VCSAAIFESNQPLDLVPFWHGVAAPTERLGLPYRPTPRQSAAHPRPHLTFRTTCAPYRELLPLACASVAVVGGPKAMAVLHENRALTAIPIAFPK
jgi:hypothetical protein